MTVEEAYKVLTNPKMSQLECNFKVKTNNPKVTLESLSHRVDSLSNTLESLSHRVDSLSNTLESLSHRVDSLTNALELLSKKLDLFIEATNNRFNQLTLEMHEGFKQINNRIDNLVIKNNLKE